MVPDRRPFSLALVVTSPPSWLEFPHNSTVSFVTTHVSSSHSSSPLHPGPAVSAGPENHPGQKLWFSCPTVLQLDQHGSLRSQCVMIERLGDIQENIHQNPLAGGPLELLSSPLSSSVPVFQCCVGEHNIYSATFTNQRPSVSRHWIFGLGLIRPLVFPVPMVFGCFPADC